jgi:hypothetical protein
MASDAVDGRVAHARALGDRGSVTGQRGTAPSEVRESGGREIAPPVGAVGYTGSYSEPSPDVVEVSVVSVLESRGPI